jgi:hypothetical protein
MAQPIPQQKIAEVKRANTAPKSFLRGRSFLMQWTCISRRGSQFSCGWPRLFRCVNQSAPCSGRWKLSRGRKTKIAMRGTPWLRFALVTIALALAAIPVWRLMRSDAPEVHPKPAPPIQAERKVTLEIVSAPTADSIRVSYLGQELVSEDQEGSYSGTLRLPSNSPADLVVKATWRGTQHAALHVQVSNEDGPIAEASYWGTDRVQDVFTIPEFAP